MIPLKITLGFHGFALHHVHNIAPEPMDSVVRGCNRHGGHRSEDFWKFMLLAG
jgi:hypothetical protein